MAPAFVCESAALVEALGLPFNAGQVRSDSKRTPLPEARSAFCFSYRIECYATRSGRAGTSSYEAANSTVKRAP